MASMNYFLNNFFFKFTDTHSPEQLFWLVTDWFLQHFDFQALQLHLAQKDYTDVMMVSVQTLMLGVMDVFSAVMVQTNQIVVSYWYLSSLLDVFPLYCDDQICLGRKVWTGMTNLSMKPLAVSQHLEILTLEVIIRV